MQEHFKDWVDFDQAAFRIAVTLGLVDEKINPCAPGQKWIFWSNNPFGNALMGIITSLVEMQVLEENEEGQYRWNAAWRWPGFGGR